MSESVEGPAADATTPSTKTVEFCGSSFERDVTEIVCRDEELSDLTPFKGLTALQTLRLWNTKVADLSPLKGLTALKTLDLSSTSVSDAEVKKLKAALPDTNIGR